jgi:hypothetical protein
VLVQLPDLRDAVRRGELASYTRGHGRLCVPETRPSSTPSGRLAVQSERAPADDSSLGRPAATASANPLLPGSAPLFRAWQVGARPPPPRANPSPQASGDVAAPRNAVSAPLIRAWLTGRAWHHYRLISDRLRSAGAANSSAEERVNYKEAGEND